MPVRQVASPRGDSRGTVYEMVSFLLIDYANGPGQGSEDRESMAFSGGGSPGGWHSPC
jgi:hypothetical protein